MKPKIPIFGLNVFCLNDDDVRKIIHSVCARTECVCVTITYYCFFFRNRIFNYNLFILSLFVSLNSFKFIFRPRGLMCLKKKQ